MNGPELFAVQLQLAATDLPALGQAAGYQAYSLVLRLLQHGDPVLARRIHGEDAAKPLTVDLPVRLQSSDPGTAEVSIRITALQGDVYDALARAVVEWDGRRPELAGIPVRIIQLLCVPGRQGVTGSTTYSELVRQGEETAGQPLALRFLTPTTFRSGGVNATFPTAGLVFGSLVRRWNAFAPLPVSEGVAQELTARLVPVAFALRTRQMDFGAYQQTGFVGLCRYEVPRGLGRESLAWAATLVRFAAYAGVGAKTTMGMGQTRLAMPTGTDQPDDGR